MFQKYCLSSFFNILLLSFNDLPVSNVDSAPIVYSVWTPKSPQHNSHYHFHSAHQLNECGNKIQDHFLQKTFISDILSLWNHIHDENNHEGIFDACSLGLRYSIVEARRGDAGFKIHGNFTVVSNVWIITAHRHHRHYWNQHRIIWAHVQSEITKLRSSSSHSSISNFFRVKYLIRPGRAKKLTGR